MQSQPCQTVTSTTAAYLYLNPRKSFALPSGVFTQVYRTICGKALALCELDERGRFTCVGVRDTDHCESAFSDTLAPAEAEVRMERDGVRRGVLRDGERRNVAGDLSWTHIGAVQRDHCWRDD